ncbi:hypothetical protein LZ30DRAFT_690004 [Colletotrichum cereale]|nr:hypothetical protein LZ30DRAFT_690004 [Colletotrichum cereale]
MKFFTVFGVALLAVGVQAATTSTCYCYNSRHYKDDDATEAACPVRLSTEKDSNGRTYCPFPWSESDWNKSQASSLIANPDGRSPRCGLPHWVDLDLVNGHGEPHVEGDVGGLLVDAEACDVSLEIGEQPMHGTQVALMRRCSLVRDSTCECAQPCVVTGPGGIYLLIRTSTATISLHKHAELTMPFAMSEDNTAAASASVLMETLLQSLLGPVLCILSTRGRASAYPSTTGRGSGGRVGEVRDDMAEEAEGTLNADDGRQASVRAV